MKIFLKHLLALLIIILFFTSCGSNSRPDGLSAADQTSLPTIIGIGFSDNEKDFLYNLFLTEYYWNDTAPKPFDYSSYTEPQPMIDDLKYPLKDHWSFAMTKEEYENFAEQKTEGFGFGYTVDMRIYIVLLESPADHAGLKRGDLIIALNGQTATEALIDTASSNLGQTTTFTVNRSGVLIDIDIQASAYSFSVTDAKTLNTPNGEKVGYLRFDSFTDTATGEIDQAFDTLKSQNIDKLVVDLRYNGGGYINTASILLDKLVRGKDGKLQFKLAWNTQNSDKDESAFFETDINSITLTQIIFLTTRDTASASELVINALKPYFGDNIVLVGDATHGKPVGMSGRSYSDNYIYFLVNFVVENADGFNDYFDGLPADCTAIDDITHNFGDPEELMLKEALHYIDTGSC